MTARLNGVWQWRKRPRKDSGARADPSVYPFCLECLPPLSAAPVGPCVDGEGGGALGQGSMRMVVHHKRDGGVPPPPGPHPQTKVTIVARNGIRCKNLVGPFFVQKLLGPRRPTPFSYFSAQGNIQGHMPVL